MSAMLNSSLATIPVVSMEVTAPVIVASPEVEKKGAKRARKEAAPAGADAHVEAPVETPAPKGKKKAAAKLPEGEPVLVEGEGVACEASGEDAKEAEKRDSSGSLIVAKAIRVLLKSHSTPIHLGSDALPALNAKVTELIYEAIGRALANGRKTLKNSDF